jgi:hypothetical protein
MLFVIGEFEPKKKSLYVMLLVVGQNINSFHYFNEIMGRFVVDVYGMIHYSFSS